MKKVFNLLLVVVGLMLLNACNGKSKKVDLNEKSNAVEQTADDILADFVTDDAITIVYRGTIGDFTRASVEVIEKGSTGAAVSFCLNDTLFTIHNVVRNVHMETFSYEKGDTLLSLSLQSGKMGMKYMIGKICFGAEQEFQVKLHQDLIYTSVYPINRFDGVPDRKVSASIRNLQKVVLNKDRDAFAALCEWPFNYRGIEVANAEAMAGIPMDDFFHDDFVYKVANAYDCFFYRESETGWYSLGQGFLWFVVQPNGEIRVKSVNHTF